jgi:predicted RNA-binding protein with TRAM domain
MSYGRGRGRGGFGGGFRPSKPAPVEVGKEYDVSITEISRRGDGIAKIEGFIIFVAGAEAGQQVKVRVTDVAPRFAKAEIVE